MTLAAFLRHLAFAAVLAGLSASTVHMMIGIGILDRPDPRKAHAVPTPTCGGVGVVVAFLAGMFVLYHFADFARLADPYFRGVILASAGIAVVAFLDDLRDWPFTVSSPPKSWRRCWRSAAASMSGSIGCPISARSMSAGSACRRPSPGSCSRPTR